jgi:hypothetical protein
MKKYTVFIIDFYDLPKHVRDVVKEWHGFGNDVFLPIQSEFDIESWSKGISEVESYWKDQCNIKNYEGSFDNFIKDYYLKFDIWFMEQKFDLTGIDKILIDVSW